MIQNKKTSVRLIKIGENYMSCSCGRSPTGKCVGWHNLSEDEYQNKKVAWEERQKLGEEAA